MRIWKSLLGVGALAGALIAPTTGFAQEADDPAAVEAAEEEADATLEAEAEEDGKPWSVAAVIASTVGQGTFVNVANDSEFADPDCEFDPGNEVCVGDASNAYDRANLAFVLVPSYSVSDFNFSGEVAAVQWLTPGGGATANEPYEFRFQDIGLSAGYKGWTIPTVDIKVTPGLSFQIPTSAVSQASSMVLGTGATLGLSRGFFDDDLTLSVGLSGGKDFHRFKSPIVSLQEAGEENVIFRAGGSEDVGNGLIAIGGVNTEYALTGSTSAAFSIWKFGASISYSLTTYWTYNEFSEEDEFTSPTADTGRGVAQLASTGVSLSYPWQPVEKLNLSFKGGIATTNYPKTADNEGFNFPFWNFNGAAANASSVKFSVTAAY